MDPKRGGCRGENQKKLAPANTMLASWAMFIWHWVRRGILILTLWEAGRLQQPIGSIAAVRRPRERLHPIVAGEDLHRIGNGGGGAGKAIQPGGGVEGGAGAKCGAVVMCSGTSKSRPVA